MSARAVIRQADLNRALKAAAKYGYEVRVEGAAIRFLPIEGVPDASLPKPDSVAKAMAAWRKSA